MNHLMTAHDTVWKYDEYDADMLLRRSELTHVRRAEHFPNPQLAQKKICVAFSSSLKSQMDVVSLPQLHRAIICLIGNTKIRQFAAKSSLITAKTDAPLGPHLQFKRYAW